MPKDGAEVALFELSLYEKDKIMYALVCLVQNGARIYTSFYKTVEEAVERAKSLSGVIAVELAHSKNPPVWTMER